MATDAAIYSQALRLLLPQGAAWETRGTPLGDLLDGLALELARVDARADVLLREADPGQASELLADWERVLGLPDPCLTTAQTTPERKAAARTRYTLVGGQSAQFFVDLAASIGYTVTVEDFPTEAAAIAAGITYTGDGWAYSWRVNVAAGTVVRDFRVGTGAAGDALRSWGVEELECVIKRYAPAHTIVFFAYA
jgi:uncharacterized protein YmfQ (DUF2313 family)